MQVQKVRDCEGLFGMLSSFSRGERKRFKYHYKQFKKLRAMSQYQSILDKLVIRLNNSHDLAIIAHCLISKAMPENIDPIS